MMDELILGLANLLVGLPLWGQLVSVGLLAAVYLIPHVAPLTPWTWDDWTIKQKGPITAFVGKLWNILAGNWGRAKNGE